MPISDGDIVRMATRCTCSSGEIINVYHYQASFPVPQDDLVVMQKLEEQMGIALSNLNNYIHSGTTPVDIKYDLVDWIGTPPKETVIRPIGIRSFPTAFAPAGAGDDLPPGVTALVKFRTTGVRTLLRKFLGVLTEADRSGGGWVGGFTSALVLYGVGLLADVTVQPGNTMAYGSWSKRLAGFAPAVSAIVSTVEGYQRRRKFGVGA